MQEPYEDTKEIDDASAEESSDELFPLNEDEVETVAKNDEVSKTASRKSVKKLKHDGDWRRRLDDYFDAKRIQELLDDETEFDSQDPLYRKSALDRIIEDLHQDEERQ